MVLSSRNCFARLPITFDAPVIDDESRNWKLKGRYTKPTKYGVALGKDVEYQPVPPELYIVEGDIRKKILSWLPEEIVALEDPEIVFIYVPPHDSGDGMFAPHVDGFRVSCINFYVDSDSEETSFYDYSQGKLTASAAFSAKTGECWALNATIPHSVSLSKTQPRKVLSVSFVDTPFERLVEILSSAGVGNVQETCA